MLETGCRRCIAGTRVDRGRSLEARQMITRLPHPQCVKYKVCMLMFKCLKGLAPAYLVAFCTKGSAVSGRSALRSAVRGDLVVPNHRTDWGLRAFAVAGPNCWNELPVELRDLTVGPETFAKHLKTHLFKVGFF